MSEIVLIHNKQEIWGVPEGGTGIYRTRALEGQHVDIYAWLSVNEHASKRGSAQITLGYDIRTKKQEIPPDWPVFPPVSFTLHSGELFPVIVGDVKHK